MEKLIQCEVAFANLEDQCVISVSLPENATVRDAIVNSGVLERFPEIDLTINKVGIFCVIVDLTKAVSEGDRIEIYRPLLIDPIARRFQRVKRSRKK